MAIHSIDIIFGIDDERHSLAVVVPRLENWQDMWEAKT